MENIEDITKMELSKSYLPKTQEADIKLILENSILNNCENSRICLCSQDKSNQEKYCNKSPLDCTIYFTMALLRINNSYNPFRGKSN